MKEFESERELNEKGEILEVTGSPAEQLELWKDKANLDFAYHMDALDRRIKALEKEKK